MHRRLQAGVQLILLVGLALEVYEAQWLNAALVAGIIAAISLLPAALSRALDIVVPAELELMAIVFVFAAVFLGETRDYYGRFAWWDIMLHTTSGGLLGVFGFLLVFVLDANPRVQLRMRAGFLAVFAFCFALAVGALWEIFEFAMDRLVGTRMQKPMLGDPSGLTDTMWDLIVDAVGALVVVAIGYRSTKRGPTTFLARRIRRFVQQNPRLFPEET